MLLAIDIGNTNIVLGLYQGEDLMSHWRIATDHRRMPDEYAMLLMELFAHARHRPEQVSGIAMASVVPPLTRTFEALCRDYFGQEPLVVDVGVKTGVRIRYDNPREVGADRVVNAAAAYRLYGGPACVVDFGTATTFDAISREGDYLGGLSLPASSSPPRPSSATRPSCPALTWYVRPGSLVPIRYTACSLASSSATWGWWRGWWPASGGSWARI